MHMYRNIILGDLLHLGFSLSRYIDLMGLIRSKSFLMVDNSGMKGYILLKKEKMKLHNYYNSNESLQFFRVYNQTTFETYKIISLHQKDDNEVIYNIFDKVLGKLNNGDFIWGEANNKSDHYIYQKLGFIKLNDKIYGYQYVI